MNKLIENIIEVGLLNKDVNLPYFLPNYPLRGSETIFSIGWANAKNYLYSNPEALIKGLHLIELEYSKQNHHDFGFGSPSPTFKLIEALAETNFELAYELYNWINDNGGNYYIPRNKLWTKEERRIRSEIEALEKIKIDKARKEKKLKIQEKHKVVMENQNKEKIIRDNLQKLNFDELYIMILKEDRRPIQYFEDAIYLIVENGITQENRTKLINLLTTKWKSNYPKKIKKTIKKIENIGKKSKKT